MTLGQVVSNVLSAGLVAGWVGLRAYEMYQAYNREHPEEVDSDDELAFERRQELLDRRRRALQGPVIFTYSSSQGVQAAQLFATGGDDLVGGPADNPFGLDLLNLQLGLVDRDFDESDYEMLLALDRDGAGRGTPISEEQLSALPSSVWSSATKQRAAAGEGSSTYHRSLQQRFGPRGNGGGTGGSSGGGSSSGGGGSATAGRHSATTAEEEAPTCSICLEHFDEGEQVSALPCCHTFHQGCVQPWLRQQGRSSTCPICKTPVFEGRA